MNSENFNIEREKLDFEKEKFEKEIELKKTQNKKKLWNNPIYITILAAIIGLIGNTVVSYINNNSQLAIERQKAEAARILEVIKTGDPDIAAENLKFLLETGLIKNDTLKIRIYLNNRKPGEGARLTVSENEILDNKSITSENISTSKDYCEKHLKYGVPNSETFNFCRIGYAMGFDVKRKYPQWVIYSIDAVNPSKHGSRRDFWQLDPEIPPQFQVSNDLYIRNDYDRGHLVNRKDVTWNEQAAKEIYVYSVVLPMHKDVNQKIWLTIENLISEALNYSKVKKLIILSGPIFDEKTIVNYRDIADIPGSFYRIVFDPLTLNSAAWIIPNKSYEQSRNTIHIDDFLVPIDEIERQTNTDFFNLLTYNEQKIVESKITDLKWLK